MAQTIVLPHAGIILLAGPSNSGKTTWLNHLMGEGIILPSEVISSDQFRTLVADTDFLSWSHRPKDESDSIYDEYKRISHEAFVAMENILEQRCRLNKLTIIDATHLYPEDRTKYVTLAKKHHVSASIIVLDVSEKELLHRDERREQPRGKKRIQQQVQVFRKHMRSIKKEGFKSQYTMKTEELDSVEFVRRKNPLLINVDSGVDLIGDIHGCLDECLQLLEELGYTANSGGLYVHPNGRRFVSLGDVMSRGPRSLETMIFFKKHVEAGLAYMIDSNHGWKIARWLDGKNVSLKHGDELVEKDFNFYEAQHGIEACEKLKEEMKEFLLRAPSHYIFQKNGVSTLVATHAGIKDEYIGKQSPAVSDFCRYGDTNGFDDEGKPIRKDWHVHHRSNLLIVWGHDPKPQPIIINNTLNLDQGVVFGGKLTAFRYPERKFVSVNAREDYAKVDDNPLKKWEMERLAPPNLAHFLNGYSVMTEEVGEIQLPSQSVRPALDEFSHFTSRLEEIVYLPPTMSPTPEPSKLDNFLEHPQEAFDYYRENGVKRMIVEKKHMGSRGILLLFKNKEAGVIYTGRESLGSIYTRKGRPFFTGELENQLLEKLNEDLVSSDYFEKHGTEFVLLDAEIMPWNLKAQELINQQYAHVGMMASLDRLNLRTQLKLAAENGQDVQAWLEELEGKLVNASTFNEVIQKYSWDTKGLQGIQIAPFHTLAHSNGTFFQESHEWHMRKNQEFAALSDLFVETEYRMIEDEATMQTAVSWWESMTEDGHEGFVVKPETFIARNGKGRLLQPAIKVRGRKYLHMIYGMDYLKGENLKRLKNRNTSKKQRNALKEFALGLEGIKRFVVKDSLERIHECPLAVLALEADPIDPRL